MPRKKGLLLFVLIILILAQLGVSHIPPLENAEELKDEVSDLSSSKVIIFLIDKVTWSDIDEARAPFLKSLIDEGAAGLLSNRTASSFTSSNRSYATIGNGNRSRAGGYPGNALTDYEKVDGVSSKILFQRQTGKNGDDFAVFYLNVTGLTNSNFNVGYTVIPGTIGEGLHESGLKTAVFGNADTDNDERLERQAAIIAMDTDGAIDFGDVGKNILEKDELSPYGIRTDFKAMFKQYEDIKNEASLFVFETGDSRRAEKYRAFANDKMTKRYRMESIARADKFMQAVYDEEQDKDTTFIILSPSPPANDDNESIQQTTPIVIAGDWVDDGLLTSGSTRREGIVTSTDIAPTVLEVLGIDVPAYLTGRAITSVPSEGEKIDRLVERNRSFIVVHELSLAVIVYFIIFQIIVLFIVVLVLYSQLEVSRSVAKLMSLLLLAMIAFPLGLFITPNIPASVESSSSYFLTIFISVVVIVAIASIRGKQRFWPLYFITGATVIFLTTNILIFGAASDLISIFGYSPITAGRFYGMGNQAMSVFVAASIVLASVILEGLKDKRGKDLVEKGSKLIKVVVAAFFILVLFVIGYPGLGANTGGIFTALAGFSVAYLYFFSPSITLKQIMSMLMFAVIALALFLTADIYLLPVKTHMGRAFLTIIEGGPAEFWQIAGRKLSANIRIFRYTSWSYLFLTIAIILIFFRVYRKNRSEEKFSSKYRYLDAGLNGGLVAGIVGALTNDSGVSITAIILAYFLAVIFYIQIFDRFLSGKKTGRIDH